MPLISYVLKIYFHWALIGIDCIDIAVDGGSSQFPAVGGFDHSQQDNTAGGPQQSSDKPGYSSEVSHLPTYKVWTCPSLSFGWV